MKKLRKVGKRMLSLVLVLALVLGLVPQNAYASQNPGAEPPEQRKTWLENQNLMKNDYIGLYTNRQGRYSIGTTGGNPDIEKDNNKKLLYGYSEGSTSYTTFRINNQNYNYSSEKSLFDVDNACNESEVDYQDIHIKQKLSFKHNSATGRDDMVEIRYTAVNNSDTEQKIGCRIMMDTKIGNNDGAPFRIPGVGSVTTETEFEGDDIPQIWQAFDSLSDPSVIAQGRFYKSREEKPDKVQFANWERLSKAVWEYPLLKGVSNGDSAVTATWYEKNIAPGETREYVTYYGLSELSEDLHAPLVLGVYSEAGLEEHDGQYMPNPFPVNAYIENIGKAAAEAASVKLELPKGLQFAGESEETIDLGNIKVGGMAQADWQVQALPVYTARDYKIRVVLSYDNGSSKSVTRTIHVPAATQKLREVPKALNYTLFSESGEQDLAMYGWMNYVTGDVYTGKNYVYSGSILDITGKVDAVGNIVTNGWQLNIDERNEQSEKIAMPDLKEDITARAGETTRFEGSKTYTEDAIRLDKSVQAEENITFAGTTFKGDGYILAGKDITCGLNQGSTYNDGKIVMYSEKGNITLNGSELYLDGILYAPEGTVSVNANIFHLKGRIIAKHIVMNTSQTYIEGDRADIGYIFDETGTGDKEDEKGHYERTFTSDADFSEGRLADVSQRMDDALVLEHSDSQQTRQKADEKEYDAKTDGTGFTLKDSLDKTAFQTGNEEAILTYKLTSFVDGSPEPDPRASEYNYVAAAAGRKVLFETTLLHAEKIDTGRIQPEADHVMENEDGSVTLQWQYDRLTAGDNFTYTVPLKYQDLSVDGMSGITRNTALQYYDTEGDFHITYLQDRYVSVTDYVKKGTWEIVCDAEKVNTDWNHIRWNGIRPDDSDITVEAAASDNGQDYGNTVKVTNGAQMEKMHGRYLKVKVTLHASSSGKTPRLDDLTVSTDGAELITNLAPELTMGNEYELVAEQPLHLFFVSQDDANGTVSQYDLQARESLDSDVVVKRFCNTCG